MRGVKKQDGFLVRMQSMFCALTYRGEFYVHSLKLNDTSPVQFLGSSFLYSNWEASSVQLLAIIGSCITHHMIISL